MYKTHLFIRRTLVLLVCFICCTFTAMAAETWTISGKPDGKFGGGSGTKNDPYLISKAQHLADLSKLSSGNLYKGKYFKMTTDIVLNDIESAQTASRQILTTARDGLAFQKTMSSVAFSTATTILSAAYIFLAMFTMSDCLEGWIMPSCATLPSRTAICTPVTPTYADSSQAS